MSKVELIELGICHQVNTFNVIHVQLVNPCVNDNMT